jgi:hypothetical protein
MTMIDRPSASNLEAKWSRIFSNIRGRHALAQAPGVSDARHVANPVTDPTLPRKTRVRSVFYRPLTKAAF